MDHTLGTWDECLFIIIWFDAFEIIWVTEGSEFLDDFGDFVRIDSILLTIVSPHKSFHYAAINSKVLKSLCKMQYFAKVFPVGKVLVNSFIFCIELF